MFTSFAKRKVMARTSIVKNFDLSFEINFNIIICAHHVYKSIWTSSIRQVLLAQADVQKEALDYGHEEDFCQLLLYMHQLSYPD